MTTKIRILKDIRHIQAHKDKRERVKKQGYKGNYIHKVPPLPRWTNKVYTSQGFKQNLYDLACTCPDFSYKKSKYKQPRDARSLCKHLYWKLTDTKASEFVEDKTLVLIEPVVKGEIEFFHKEVLHNKREVIFGFSNNGEPWLGVYTINEFSKWTGYFYSYQEKRFAYGNEPPDKVKIVNKLREVILNNSILEV